MAARRVQALATMLDALSVIPGTNLVEREPTPASVPLTYVLWQAHVYTHVHTQMHSAYTK